jgi:thiol:disulfide interchange protein DsbA
MKLISVLMLLGTGVVYAQTGSQERYQDGVHYITLDIAAPARNSGPITVTEIFSYGCHACNDFEPFVQSWKAKQAEDVKLNRIAVGFGRRAWELLARGYIIAEILGVEEQSHVPMMNAIWKEGKQMRTMEELADFYSQFGAEKSKFLALDGSFMMNMRYKQNADKLGLYAVRGTPTMVVAGRYKIQTGQAVPNYQVMLSVVDHLVEKERAAMAPVAETAPAVEDSLTSN